MHIMRTCYIVGAAPQADIIAPQPGDCVIAADGGMDHLSRWGILPDLLIGDFDSIADIPEGIPRKQFPGAKDETDLRLAMEEGYARGFRRMVITGAWGGRPDHSAGNLQLLVWAARQGCRVQMRCGDFTAAALAGGDALRLRGTGTVSVFAYGGQALGVTLQGLEYPLEDAILYDDTPLGVSNHLAGEGMITLAQGMLLLFWASGIACEDVSI